MSTVAIENTAFTLETYDVHPERGFLPAGDPITRLPTEYDPWEELLQQLPALLAVGRVRPRIERLPLLDTKHLNTRDLQERAMLLLSYLAHAYTFGADPVSTRIPAQVAVPWHAIARQLKRPPVLSYASLILYNWRRIDPDQPIELENLARLEHFLGGMDEDWFGMVHIVIEAKAGPGLHALVVAQDGVRDGDVAVVAQQLDMVTQSLVEIMAVFDRIPERCDPYIYYNRVRPFLSGWQDNPAFPNGMIYEGVKAFKGQPQFLRGGSGAQSAIIPAMDDALGIAFDDNPFGHFMRSLRDYMPPGHKAFIEVMSQRPAIRDFVLRHARAEHALTEAYNRCITTMGEFRRDHLKFAAKYIHAQSQRSSANSTEVGTGGTPFMPYLKQHMGDVQHFLIS
jgi:indoleamine 2,3-dioxygenase